MDKNKIKEFLCTKQGLYVLTAILMVGFLFFASILGALTDVFLGSGLPAGIAGVAEVVLTVVSVAIFGFWGYFGWKSLTGITPRIFLILPIAGWVFYFIVKGILSVIVGLFVAPYHIAKLIVKSLESAPAQPVKKSPAKEQTKGITQTKKNVQPKEVIYTEEKLQKMTIREINVIYDNISEIVMANLNESATKKIPRGTESYGCETLGDARELMDLCSKVMGEKIAKNTAAKEMAEKITDKEKQKLMQLGKMEVATTAHAKAIKGDAQGMLLIGMIYDMDLNIPQKAFYWMRKAAKKGNVQAEYFLGTYYAEGYGVAKNRTQGIGMILSAAEKGNEDAIECCKNKLGMTMEDIKNYSNPI